MNKEMLFYNLVGFYQNKDYYKYRYSKMSIDEKEIYKMYVYSLPFMDDNTKDLIWEYLNGWDEDRKNLVQKWKKARKKLSIRKKNVVNYAEMEIVDNDDEFR